MKTKFKINSQANHYGQLKFLAHQTIQEISPIFIFLFPIIYKKSIPQNLNWTQIK